MRTASFDGCWRKYFAIVWRIWRCKVCNAFESSICCANQLPRLRLCSAVWAEAEAEEACQRNQTTKCYARNLPSR